MANMSVEDALMLVELEVAKWDESPRESMVRVEKLFISHLKKGHICWEKTLNAMDADPPMEIEQTSWLTEWYEKVWLKILDTLDHDFLNVRTQALSTAVKLMMNEGLHFPIQRLKKVLMRILSPDRDNTSLIAKYQTVAKHPEVLCYTWKCLPSITPKTQPQKIYIKNLLELIDKIPLEQGLEVRVPDHKQLLYGLQYDSNYVVCDYATARRAMNKVWACVMHWELSPELHKLQLTVLLERVMPHLEKPVLLTDFLMDSLDVDGTIGYLALEGVFVLVTKHNLEYPNIFTKLYSMFEPEILYTKCKARLFYLSDLFLSSTHLPKALVAAFAKRLARLTLVARPADIRIILLFLMTLLRRHPELKTMIDRPKGGAVQIDKNSGARDPFLMEERDPLLSNALQSSLWEINALQWHILPTISSPARIICGTCSSGTFDLQVPFWKLTGLNMFDRELKRKVKDIMLTFERPNSIALPNGEKLLKYWHLMSTH